MSDPSEQSHLGLLQVLLGFEVAGASRAVPVGGWDRRDWAAVPKALPTELYLSLRCFTRLGTAASAPTR